MSEALPDRIDRTHAVQLRPRHFTLRYWFALRENFTRKQCLQIMWYGGEMNVEECE
jgi:hypothetical protein